MLIISIPICCVAQQDNKRFEDSVFNHYVKNGAFKQPLYSRARERYLDSALVLIPQHAYTWQQRSMPLLKQYKYEIGMQYLDSAVKYDAKNWIDYRAFVKCIFQKNYTGALADFDAARNMNGNSAVMDHPYDFYSALCYLQMNRFDTAEALIRKCIDERREKLGDKWVHYVHWYYLGVVCFEQERHDEALNYFDKALVTYPRLSDAEFYKAMCLSRKNDYTAALPIIQQANADADKGYTLNEDNVFYETYPYQVKKYLFKPTLKWVQDMVKLQQQ